MPPSLSVLCIVVSCFSIFIFTPIIYAIRINSLFFLIIAISVAFILTNMKTIIGSSSDYNQAVFFFIININTIMLLHSIIAKKGSFPICFTSVLISLLIAIGIIGIICIYGIIISILSS